MTPKEKALNLIDRFENYSFEDIEQGISAFSSAKQCVLIAVDEIIESVLPSSDFGGDINKNTVEYWKEVKQEIKKL